MTKKLLLLYVCTLLTVDCLAQTEKLPTAEFNKKGMYELSNLYSEKDGCYKHEEPFQGTIVKREFAEDELTIIGLVLMDENDNRTYINIDSEQVKKLSRAAYSNLSSFLGKGKQMEIWVYGCGASESVLIADKMKLL